MNFIDFQTAGFLAIITPIFFKVLFAIIIFGVGFLLSGFLATIIKKICIRAKLDDTLSIFLSKATKTLVLIIAIIAALSQLGIDTSSFVAILATSSLAIGLAFKDNMSNVGAGVVLIFLRPYKVGDSIQTAQGEGIVEEIGLFHTLIRTLKNDIIIVPNAKFINDKITNLSVKDTKCVVFESSVNSTKLEEAYGYLTEQIKNIQNNVGDAVISVIKNDGANAVLRAEVFIKNDEKYEQNLTALNISINPILQHLKTFS